MIFLIIIKNTSSKIEVPNTVLGDASRLIPDPLLSGVIYPVAKMAYAMDLGSVTITAVVYRSTSGKSTDP